MRLARKVLCKSLTPKPSWFHNLTTMRTIAVLALLVSFLLPAASAQAASPGPKVDPNNPNRVQLDETLQRYLAAYAHKNYQQLLAVWPTLADERKEAEKIRRHLEDGSVSEEQMSVQPLETDSTPDGAVIRAQRTEQYVKTERNSSISHGDLNMGNMPVQDPGPSQTEKKKPFKKTDSVWIKFRKTGDDWTIASVTSQKPQ
jgi:hypothetical protein